MRINEILDTTLLFEDEKDMQSWVQAHLTMMRDRDIPEVSLSSIAKELNRASWEMGWPQVDPESPEELKDLIQSNKKLSFIDKIEDGVVYIRTDKNKNKDSKENKKSEEPEEKEPEEDRVDAMAKHQVRKQTKGRKL